MLSILKDTRKHFMTGVSYMIPFVVAGGVLLALAVMISGKAAVPDAGILKSMSTIGIAGLTLFIPILGGFIAYSISDKAGIAPGAIGAYLANSMGAGFLGGMLSGLIAGILVYYIIQIIKSLKLPDFLKSIMPIFIIPLLGTFLTGMIVIYIIGDPIAGIMKFLGDWLSGMQDSSKVVMGIILGCMITFDMGGPMNKTAFFFAVALMGTTPELMAAVAAPVCTPPLGMALATFLFKGVFTSEEREAGKPALIMGCIGISEGAIPFAASDPLRVIPANMVGGAVASIVSLIFGATNHAPWGGLIVLPIVGNPVGYVIAVALGALTTAVVVMLLKKYWKSSKQEITDSADDDFNITLN
ncbi:PTS fructose transporter subunit EIIC [Tolumonas osonensis]|uniref:Fructose-specific PTS system IIC-like component n=1 Tax=Tolumonas osonensis TaxID=675874 RepID=A0A841GIV5_9GAMM|nr:PTS fructose transporter subunit EIIC [Tolumonas osonensis]MBB6054442.1 fructose-specific PTS system IIC-like component [Tolumonas osonensis]